MKKREWKSRTKRDLMIEVWEHLDCETVGARELEAVADAGRERFGEGAVEGPAVVARPLADEGAELRHPEVLDADARWRTRPEEHTAELQSLAYLVCRLLLEKKKMTQHRQV